MEAGLRHGNAGISHIYHRMYRNTGFEAFNASAAYWFDQSLNIAVHQDGYAGFMLLRPGDKNEGSPL